MGRDKKNKGFDTRAITVGEGTTAESNDIITPIHLSSTFEWDVLDPEENDYMYSRLTNPTRETVEKKVASLEGGEHAIAFGSGTAAIAVTCLSILNPGDHLVAFKNLYGGTKKMFTHMFRDNLDVDVEYVDATDTTNVEEAVREDTKLIWMETPTNPLMKLCDISAIADIADEYDTPLGVDNTFMSPYFQRPLELGADIVVHSTTKFLNGHSDSVGGVMVTDNEELYDETKFYHSIAVGAMLSPFDSYMVSRGIKTLPARMRLHEENAREIAEYLEGHEMVEKVNYPGLKSHPQHELAKEQMDGFGALMSMEVKGGFEGAKTLLENLEEFSLAVSLGGVESLIEHPASMTHANLEKDILEGEGIKESLVRLSIGIEKAEDLIADLENGLEKVKKTQEIAHQ